MKDKEPHGKHTQGNDANGKDEPSPALVRRPVPNEPPRQQTTRQLAYGPPYTQQRKETALCVGQELEKERTIDGEVAADAKAEQCEEETDHGPGGCVGDEHAKDCSDEECGVEGDAAAEDVGADAPGEGAEAESEVEPRGCVADLFLRDGEFGGEGG